MPGIQHLQVRVNGLLGTNQTWSVNPKFSYPGSPTSVPTQAAMDSWAAAIIALESGDIIPNIDMISNSASVLGVTCSFITADNTSLVISEGTLATPVTGTGAASMPGQCAVVSTILTNIPGRSGRGRLYWPYIALGMTDELRIPLTDAQTIASNVGAWLHDVAAAWPGSEPVVASVVSRVKSAAYPATIVRVGDVVDTQRRRRDQLIEGTRTGGVS